MSRSLPIMARSQENDSGLPVWRSFCSAFIAGSFALSVATTSCFNSTNVEFTSTPKKAVSSDGFVIGSRYSTNPTQLAVADESKLGKMLSPSVEHSTTTTPVRPSFFRLPLKTKIVVQLARHCSSGRPRRMSSIKELTSFCRAHPRQESTAQLRFE